jgi:predicted DNA-binding transcriptional regulator YafY
LFATGMHRADLEALTPSLEKLRSAAFQHRWVRLNYQSQGQSEPATRELDPYALVHRWGWLYVIGFCHLRQAVRTFRLDRIKELALLGTSFESPRDFDLRAYLANETQAQPQVTAQMYFAQHVAHVALEGRSFWVTLHKQTDGSIVVSFAAPTLEWAASIALAYGPLVEVLDPPELRRMVLEWAQGVVAKYES